MSPDAGLPDAGLPDAGARRAVVERLDETLFVEAGAGTGKTSALIGRVLALVGTGAGVPIRHIAAITFTEKAATELRDRLRAEFDARGDDASLAGLDAAAICTLHAFAQRILTEFAIEAGLPPRIEVHDELTSRIVFQRRWQAFVDELLDTPELEDAVTFLLASGVGLDGLRRVAELCNDNWDLLDRIGPEPRLGALPVGPWLAALRAVCDRDAECTADDDPMRERLEALRLYAERIAAAPDDAERVRLLRLDKPSFRVGRCGRAGNWPDLGSVRDDIGALDDDRAALLGRHADAAIRQVLVAVAQHTISAVAERRAAGRLEFHDLLVLTRTLLRDPVHGVRARERLRDRYLRLLIDEFQDTDPIQVDIAALLASADPGAGGRSWEKIEPEPGRLFFVGDPKQSIYRFRRADISVYLEAARHFAGAGALDLVCNFRTTPAVLDFVNAVFSELIVATPGSQPEYHPLVAARPHPGPGSVTLLGADAHGDAPDAEGLRTREAADVAAVIRTAIADGWVVEDRDTGAERGVRLGDICVLLPARTSLDELEQALDAAGIAYRAETSSLVYSTREVRDLLAALRAIDDPTDELAVVTALRSALFGCGDDDLYAYHVEHRGSWDMRRDPPASLPDDDVVVAGVRALRVLHEARHWATPSELLTRLIDERRVLEVAAGGPRFRDVARRVRFLVDQARAFSDAADGTLRDYLAWATLQGAEGSRVVEAVLPETDDDAVRIMTVHGAKGLEFPVVVCSGMTTTAQPPMKGVQLLFPGAGGCEAQLAKDVRTAGFDRLQPGEEQMGADEKLRLLYVAATRARDHLVVSVHRVARAAGKAPTRPTHAEIVWEPASRASGWAPFEGPAPGSGGGGGTRPTITPMPIDAWETEYARAFAAGSRRHFVSATALAKRTDPSDPDPALAKDPPDLESPPWHKGRYGTAIGRAVHAVLQTIDLRSGAGLDEAVAAQAAAEGVLGREGTIAALTRSALASDVVQRAASGRFWRETYVAVPLGDITLEGYVDLVYRDGDGLVVVDYKTDAVAGDELEARVARYRLQAAAYALAVSEAAGEPVVRAVLCLLDPAGAREFVVEGPALAAAVAEIRDRAAAEAATPAPVPAAGLPAP